MNYVYQLQYYCYHYYILLLLLLLLLLSTVCIYNLSLKTPWFLLSGPCGWTSNQPDLALDGPAYATVSFEQAAVWEAISSELLIDLMNDSCILKPYIIYIYI